MSFKDPEVACAFFRDKLGQLEREVFVAAMLAGMGIYEVLERRRIAPPSTQAR